MENLHLHIRDHMNDCIRGIIHDIADELYDRAEAIRQSKLADKGAVEALEFAGQEIGRLAKQFT